MMDQMESESFRKSQVEMFADELKWCINQLELGLQRQSPDSRQAQETFKVLKILRSTKAPLVKKRQAMRNALGDYRKKMKDEEKKSLNAMRHSRFKAIDNRKITSKSKFLRRSQRTEAVYEQQNELNEMLNMDLNNLNLQSASFDSKHFSLCLNDSELPLSTQLPVVDDKVNNCHISLHNGQTNVNCESHISGDDGSNVDVIPSRLGELSDFKYSPSDNSFAFNFNKDNNYEVVGNVDHNLIVSSEVIKTSDVPVQNLDEEKSSTDSNVSENPNFKFTKSNNSFSFDFTL